MNQNSPNSLKDSIKIQNSNLGEINVVGINGKYYCSDIALESFMRENGIADSEFLIESLADFYGIGSLSILDEEAIDNESETIIDESTAILLEALNPFKVVKTAQGLSIFKEFIDQFSAFITNRPYSDEEELKRYIHRCDKMIKAIEDERKLVAEKGKGTSQALFTCMYIFNIAKKIFFNFILPSILTNVSLKVPKSTAKVLGKDAEKIATKVAAGSTVGASVASSAPKAVGKVATGKSSTKVFSNVIGGIDLALHIPSDLEGIYFSLSDYDRLLRIYETQIKSVKNDLSGKLSTLKRQKEMNSRMVKLTEDSMSKDAVEVHYQTPEELMDKDHTPEVVHDDDQHTGMELTADEVLDREENPAIEVEPEVPTKPEITADFTPIDAINQVRSDPANVSIAKYGNKFYIDHKDLKCYMDACGLKKYESALNSIIGAHEDANLCPENIRVIMGRNDMSSLDSETKATIESSEVQFEVY